jgi:hypothetical protein
LPATDPCNQVALYLGWYSQDAVGPWVTSPNRFVPGAIAYHLHSFSASTIRNESANWVAPLLAHGAAATMGMVYEPYLTLTPHEDIFTRRLLQDNYFAEAAYASEPALSWMLTVVGDPLYRPFRQPLDSALSAAGTPRTSHYDWLLLQKVKRELLLATIDADSASLRRALEIPGVGAVAEEGLGDLLLEANEPSAVDAYHKAIGLEIAPIDRIRVGLKLADYYAAHNSAARAQAELDQLWASDAAEARRFGVPSPLSPSALMPVNGTVGNHPVVSPKADPGAAPQLPRLPKPTPLPQPQ